MIEIKREEIFDKYCKILLVIKRMQEVLSDWDVFDALHFSTTKSTEKEYAVMVISQDIEIHTKNIILKLKQLFELLQTQEIIVISTIKQNLFGNKKNKYEKVVTANSILRKYFPKNNYNEALILNVNKIDDFVEAFFLLERYDMGFPELYWFDKDQRFYFYFCNKGNIHIVNLKGNKPVTRKLLLQLGFKIDDYDQFYNGGAIKGRMLRM
jgi:hypothetical protein